MSYIVFILYVLIIFIIYQTRYSFSNKCKPLSTKFRKRIWCTNEDNNVSSVIFVVHFDLQCVNVTSNNSTESKTSFTDRKRDIILCVIIPCGKFNLIKSSYRTLNLVLSAKLFFSLYYQNVLLHKDILILLSLVTKTVNFLLRTYCKDDLLRCLLLKPKRQQALALTFPFFEVTYRKGLWCGKKTCYLNPHTVNILQ